MNPVFDRDSRRKFVNAALSALDAEALSLIGATVLVTGARGFFGRYVIEALLEQNKRWREGGKLSEDQLINIVASDSFAVGNAEDHQEEWRGEPHLTFMKTDIVHGSGGGMSPPIGRKFTHVWHLAGIASPYWYKKLPEETIAVSVDGTRNMLRLARDHGARFMFTSSSEVYQTAMLVPTPETYVGNIPSMNERSCYDVSKLMAETLCYVEAQKNGTHVSVVRIFNSFGPGMSEKDRRILPRIASAMKGARGLTVFGKRLSDDGNPPLPSRTYTPVANTLLGFLKVALLGEPVPAGVYNVGLDTDEMNVIELLNLIHRRTGQTVKYTVAAPPSNYETEPLRRCPDITKLKALGYKPCMSLEEGVSDYFKWALESYSGEE